MSKEFVYAAEVFRFYHAVRQRGLDVDFVPQGGDLTGYRLIVVPPLPIVRPEFLEALRRSSGMVLFEEVTTTFTDMGRSLDDTPDFDLPDPKAVPVDLPVLGRPTIARPPTCRFVS